MVIPRGKNLLKTTFPPLPLLPLIITSTSELVGANIVLLQLFPMGRRKLLVYPTDAIYFYSLISRLEIESTLIFCALGTT